MIDCNPYLGSVASQINLIQNSTVDQDLKDSNLTNGKCKEKTAEAARLKTRVSASLLPEVEQ